jgi:hypothetical protein
VVFMCALATLMAWKCFHMPKIALKTIKIAINDQCLLFWLSVGRLEPVCGPLPDSGSQQAFTGSGARRDESVWPRRQARVEAAFGCAGGGRYAKGHGA